MTHEVPALPYAYNALEPHIDETTMKLHHDKHHQTYVDKLNAALQKHPELAKKTVEDLLKNLNAVPEDIRTAVRNHGGGHYNHTFFWVIMTPKSSEPSGKLAQAITKKWGSVDKFKEEFTTAATGVFGSGWAWLVKDKNELSILTTPNQDNPISQGKMAILGVDVWEHSYYKKYGPDRASYVKAWFNVVNWKEVEKRFS